MKLESAMPLMPKDKLNTCLFKKKVRKGMASRNSVTYFTIEATFLLALTSLRPDLRKL